MPGAYQPYIRATIPGRVIGRIKKAVSRAMLKMPSKRRGSGTSKTVLGVALFPHMSFSETLYPSMARIKSSTIWSAVRLLLKCDSCPLYSWGCMVISG